MPSIHSVLRFMPERSMDRIGLLERYSELIPERALSGSQLDLNSVRKLFPMLSDRSPFSGVRKFDVPLKSASSSLLDDSVSPVRNGACANVSAGMFSMPELLMVRERTL